MVGVRSEGHTLDLGMAGQTWKRQGEFLRSLQQTDRCPATGLSLSRRRELCPSGFVQLEDPNEKREERTADHRCKGLDTPRLWLRSVKSHLMAARNNTPTPRSMEDGMEKAGSLTNFSAQIGFHALLWLAKTLHCALYYFWASFSNLH